MAGRTSCCRDDSDLSAMNSNYMFNRTKYAIMHRKLKDCISPKFNLIFKGHILPDARRMHLLGRSIGELFMIQLIDLFFFTGVQHLIYRNFTCRTAASIWEEETDSAQGKPKTIHGLLADLPTYDLIHKISLKFWVMYTVRIAHFDIQSFQWNTIFVSLSTETRWSSTFTGNPDLTGSGKPARAGQKSVT